MSWIDSMLVPIALRDQAINDVGLTAIVERPADVVDLLSRTGDLLDESGSLVDTTVGALTETILPVIGPQRLPDVSDEARFVALQKWQGRVLDVHESTFRAALFDLIDGVTEEEAEFQFDDVREDDLPLVQEGAVFYWSIGYRTDGTGERSRVSLIRFRRLSAWTQRDVQIVDARAADLRRRLGM